MLLGESEPEQGKKNELDRVDSCYGLGFVLQLCFNCCVLITMK